MSDQVNYIYCYNWWGGFENGTDANHIGFFKKLFEKTRLRNFEFTNDIQKATILLEAGKPDNRIRSIKNWKYKINFIGEPDLPEAENYDFVLTSVNTIPNVIDLPLSFMYIHTNNFFARLINLPKITSIPSQFCTFIVSNPNCEIRNKIFESLNKYRKVHSWGRYANNMGMNLHYNYWSEEYFNILGSHKFMICCENTKMTTYTTEKIVNPYLARTIPIYWGSPNIKNIFNPDSMLYLEDESEISFAKLIDKVIELDNDDTKYLEFINRPIFTKDNLKYIEENYSLEGLAQKIDKIIS